MSGPRVVRLSLDGVVPEDTRLLLALGGGGKPCDVTDAVGDLAWACDLALAGTALGHDYDPDHRERARAIGEALHRAGGRDAMAAVHDALLRLAGAERAALVECWWDGVGDWRWWGKEWACTRG